MFDLAVLVTTPKHFAHAFAHVLGRGASLIDEIAERTADPSWSQVAVELDRLALRLQQMADAVAAASGPTIARA